MGVFNTSKVHDNEVVKATDFDYGFKSFIENFGLGMKLVLGRTSNFVIGGLVKKSASLGMNLAIEPLYSYCKTSVTDIVQGCGSDEVIDLVTVLDAGSKDRIDIVEVCGIIESYDEQQRAVNDPETNIKTYPMLDIKQRIKVYAKVKQGTPGSAIAPATDAGYVKLAEVKVPANATEIKAGDIYPITADIEGVENTGWTNEKTATINIGTICALTNRLRIEHNQDGSHKEKVIKASNIDFGTGSTQVNATKISKGGSAKTAGQSTLNATDSMSTIAETIADEINHRNFVYIGSTQDNVKKYFTIKNPGKDDVIVLLTRAGEEITISCSNSDSIYKWSSYVTRNSDTYSKIKNIFYDSNNNLIVYLESYAYLYLKSLNGLTYTVETSTTQPTVEKEISILTVKRDTTVTKDSANLVTSGAVESAISTLSSSVSTSLDNKVDKETGKGLSTNDFTTTLKTKLDGIAEGANKISVDTTMSSTSTNPVQNKVVQAALDNKVNKETGKGLSTNDFTTTLKTKLDGIAEGANKISVDSSMSSTSTNPVQNKVVQAALDNNVNSIAEYINGVFGRFTLSTQTITAATTANITLKALQTIDGVSLAVNNVVLVKNQTEAKNNGLYAVSTTNWERLSGFTTESALKEKIFKISNGTTNKNKLFYITNKTFTVGTDAIEIAEYKRLVSEQLADNLNINDTLNATTLKQNNNVVIDSSTIGSSHAGSASKISRSNLEVSSSPHTLIEDSGSTDTYKLEARMDSADNLEIRHTLGDDVATSETWYGNATKMMSLVPTGTGTAISGGKLSVNGVVKASSGITSDDTSVVIKAEQKNELNIYPATAGDNVWINYRGTTGNVKIGNGGSAGALGTLQAGTTQTATLNVTGNATVSGTLNASLAWSKITDKPAYITGSLDSTGTTLTITLN